MTLFKKSIVASIGVLLLALTLALTGAAQAAAQAVKDVVVVNTTSQPVPVVAQGTTAIKGTVGLDPAANTVKLDQANNGVRITNSSLPVTGTVNVGNQPPFAFDANGNLKTVGTTASQGRAAAVVINVGSRPVTGNPASFTSDNLAVGQFTELAIDVGVASFSPGTVTCQATLTTKRLAGGFAPYREIDRATTSPVDLSTNFGLLSRSLGVGAPQNVSFGNVTQVTLDFAGCLGSRNQWSLTVIGK